MLVLDKFFIHIPKTGGSAIRKYVPNINFSRPQFHKRYLDINLIDRYNHDFFCVIRNPWQLVASRYNYIKNGGMGNNPLQRESWDYVRSVDFKTFVKEKKGFGEQYWVGPPKWDNQMDWIVNERGEVKCECLKFEVLNQSLNRYLGKVIQLPKFNTSPKYNYLTMYDDETIKLVGKYYEKDVDFFGFQFKTGSQRHTI
jgi:chondroitin 4-sulfotransferase 11